MPKSLKQSGAAVQYARALLDLANEKEQAELIGQIIASSKLKVQVGGGVRCTWQDMRLNAC